MIKPSNNDFTIAVYDLIERVPMGKVVSYSQVSVMCGRPGSTRRVGQIAHFGPTELPWHRLVHANGLMALGFVPGGPDNQAKLLIDEGVEVVKGKVLIGKYQWI